MICFKIRLIVRLRHTLKIKCSFNNMSANVVIRLHMAGKTNTHLRGVRLQSSFLDNTAASFSTEGQRAGKL